MSRVLRLIGIVLVRNGDKRSVSATYCVIPIISDPRISIPNVQLNGVSLSKLTRCIARSRSGNQHVGLYSLRKQGLKALFKKGALFVRAEHKGMVRGTKCHESLPFNRIGMPVHYTFTFALVEKGTKITKVFRTNASHEKGAACPTSPYP